VSQRQKVSAFVPARRSSTQEIANIRRTRVLLCRTLKTTLTLWLLLDASLNISLLLTILAH